MNAFELHKTLFSVGETQFSRGDVVAIAACVLALLAIGLLFSLWRAAKRRQTADEWQRRDEAERSRDVEARMAELIATQNELTGRLAAMQDNATVQQSAFAKHYIFIKSDLKQGCFLN